MAEIQPVEVARGELASLTAIRAVAAATVFLAHTGFAITATTLSGAAEYLERVGNTGVPLFFVLSGFLLAQATAWRGGPWRFLRRRAARILPVYAFALCASLAVLMVFQPGDARLDSGNVLANALLVQSWLPAGMEASINVPAWSLSVELFFYALLPLVIGPFAAFVERRPGLALAVTSLGLLGSTGIYWSGSVPSTLPLLYLPTFFFGICIARWPDPPRVPVRVAVAASVAAVVGSGFVAVPNWPPYALTTAPFALLILALAQRDTDKSARPPAAWLVTAGKWSYAFFLLHTVVIFVLNGAVTDPPTSLGLGVALLVVYFSLSWLLAGVTYRLVEEPARRALIR